MDANDKVIRTILVSVIGASLIALFAWVWNTNGRLAVMETDTSTHGKFWGRHNWAKTQINTLRTLHDMPIIDWHIHMDDEPE